MRNYEYFSQKVIFQKSYVCLESHYSNVVVEFFPAIREYFLKMLSIEFENTQSDCGGAEFNTIKYSSQKYEGKKLEDDYEEDEIEGKILLEMSLSLDQFKTETVRQSTDILEMIGDVGGFQGAFIMLTAIVGAFFSELFFKASITENFYIRTLSAQELKDKKVKSIKDMKSMFKVIKFSTVQLFLDPIISCIAPLRVCNKLSCRKRTKMLEKGFDKFNSQLDIEKLLNHLRDSENILKSLQDKEQKMMLRFAKNRTLNIEDSESSSEESRHQLDSEASEVP